MEIKYLFLFFGIALAALAVIVTVIGMRKENFPDRRTFIGLLVVTAILVVGTGFYAVELSIEEAHEREKNEKPIGEEASVAPLRISDGVS